MQRVLSSRFLPRVLALHISYRRVRVFRCLVYQKGLLAFLGIPGVHFSICLKMDLTQFLRRLVE
jgi:hypothetical protein